MYSIELKKTVELIWVKAMMNLRSEASVNYLSYAWWVIEPLMHMVVYFLVFSFLLNRGGDGYIAFLLTGLIPWLWFAKTISHSMGSILQGKQLINQLHIPKIFFPLTFVIQDFVKQIIVFVLLLVFLYYYLGGLPLTALYVIPIIVIQLILLVGFALLSAIVVPFVRDMTFVIPTGLQFLMFCSGIFFSHHDVPVSLHSYFFLNPVAVLLAAYRDTLLDGIAPNFLQLGYVAIFGSIMVLLAAYLYKKLEFVLPRVVLE
ncbi:ABC transporter permease [Vibrio sp. La 4.2.2]|uniref:ABC transporter permease n=1 Tax=Vibrio sp. La 4.2.2 TaxID=2998830 RepID=UPI0022CDC47C|nr:ABC transporter permease [Vibrio sp. La 4.2.2]MDA0110539.1 ABC transporter permease [Vibrio sp. La 4.2.2]